MAKHKNEYQRFMALPDAEKDAEAAEFDKPLPSGRDGLVGRPLSAADRALHRKAARAGKIGRPKVGQGAQMVAVSIERGLLATADRYAKSHGLNRSELIDTALRLIVQAG